MEEIPDQGLARGGHPHPEHRCVPGPAVPGAGEPGSGVPAQSTSSSKCWGKAVVIVAIVMSSAVNTIMVSTSAQPPEVLLSYLVGNLLSAMTVAMLMAPSDRADRILATIEAFFGAGNGEAALVG